MIGADQPVAPALDLPTDGTAVPPSAASAALRSGSLQSVTPEESSARPGGKSPSPDDCSSAVDGLSQTTCSVGSVTNADLVVTEPRPPAASRPAGSRHHSGRTKKSPGASSTLSGSSAGHSNFIGYSKVIDQDIAALLDATIVRLNEKQDEQSLHEIFRIPILERPDAYQALLAYLVKHICLPQYSSWQQGAVGNAASSGSSHSSAASSPVAVQPASSHGESALVAARLSSPIPMESGVGLNRFILFHLLGLHDDEGSSSTERVLDPINASKRDQFHGLIISSYLVPACRGTRSSTKTSALVSATCSAETISAAISLVGISPAFVRLLDYMLTLSSPANKLALLDGILHPRAQVLRYAELCAQLSLASPKYIRTDVLCGNVRLLKSMLTITNSEQGKFWTKVLQSYQKGAATGTSSDHPMDVNTDHHGASLPELDVTGESPNGPLEMRQMLAVRISRAIFAPLIANAAATQTKAADGAAPPHSSTKASNNAASCCVLGAYFLVYKNSGGSRKNGLFHSTVNALLRIILDTDLLAPMRRVVMASYRPLLPTFFTTKCDEDALAQALVEISRADIPSGPSSTAGPAASDAHAKDDRHVVSASPVASYSACPTPPIKAVRPPSHLGGVLVDEVAPPPDARQMEDLARFSPALKSSLGRISPAFGGAHPHDAEGALMPRDQSVSPLPQILPHRPHSGGPSRSQSINHLPKSPAVESIECNRVVSLSPQLAPLEIVDEPKACSVSSSGEPSPLAVTANETTDVDGEGGVLIGAASSSCVATRPPSNSGKAGKHPTAAIGRRSSSGGQGLAPTLPKQPRLASSSGGARKASSASPVPASSGARSPTNGAKSPVSTKPKSGKP
jgi:hypothetical protein